MLRIREVLDSNLGQNAHYFNFIVLVLLVDAGIKGKLDSVLN